MTSINYMPKARLLEGVASAQNVQRIAHNTVKYTVNGETRIRYVKTDIVTTLPDGTIILNAGDLHSATTKKRINEQLPPGYVLTQKDFQWFLNGVPFENGMRIKASGRIVGPDDVHTIKLALAA